MTIRRQRREYRQIQLENALADARRHHELHRPVKVGERWVPSERQQALWQLARFVPTRWTRSDAALEHPLREGWVEAQLQASAGVNEVGWVRPAPLPWATDDEAVLRDNGRVGAPGAVETVPLPWLAVHDAVLAGRAPVAVLNVIEHGPRSYPRRAWSEPLLVDPAQVSRAQPLTRRDGEALAAEAAVARGAFVVALRQPDGRVVLASANMEEESGRAASINIAAAVRATWSPGIAGVETIAAPDGMIRFPVAGGGAAPSPSMLW